MDDRNPAVRKAEELGKLRTAVVRRGMTKHSVSGETGIARGELDDFFAGRIADSSRYIDIMTGILGVLGMTYGGLMEIHLETPEERSSWLEGRIAEGFSGTGDDVIPFGDAGIPGHGVVYCFPDGTRALLTVTVPERDRG